MIERRLTDRTEFTELWYHRETRDYLNKCSKNYLILDVGIGKGHYMYLFPKWREYIFGDIKIDEELLRKKSRQCGDIHICQLDACILPFKKGSFDIIISHQTIEHLNDPNNFIDEIYRILKEGGMAVISTVIKGRFARRKALANNHIKEFKSVTEFVDAFCRKGFHLALIEKRPINFPFKKFLPRWAVKNFVDLLDKVTLPIPLYYYNALLIVQK